MLLLYWRVLHQLYQHQQYILETNHSYSVNVVLISGKFWDAFPEIYKGVIQKSLIEAIHYAEKLIEEESLKARQSLDASKDVEIIPMTVKAREDLVNLMVPIWRELEGDIGKELIDTAASQR